MEQYEFVRTKYRLYGLSVSEIARQTCHSRKAVRKVLRNEHSGYSYEKIQHLCQNWRVLRRSSTPGLSRTKRCMVHL